MGLTKCFIYFFASCATLIFPPIKSLIGIDGVFFYFTALSMLCTIWGFLKIPETRGKSLIKVEEIYEIDVDKNRKCNKL